MFACVNRRLACECVSVCECVAGCPCVHVSSAPRVHEVFNTCFRIHARSDSFTCIDSVRPFILNRESAENAFTELDPATLSGMVAQMRLQQEKLSAFGGKVVTEVVPHGQRRNSSALSVSATKDAGQKFGMCVLIRMLSWQPLHESMLTFTRTL